MSQCLVKLPHSCGSRNALQVFENEDGSVSGYCFSCKTSVPHPLGVGKNAEDIPQEQRLRKTKEEIEAELVEISSYPVVDLVARRLRADALDYYGIKIGVSEQDGITPAFQYFPYYKGDVLTSYKVKLLDGKKFWSVGDQKDVDLFGWKQAKSSGARRLIITEGENDAVALRKIFEIYEKEEYKDTIPAVVSLQHGVKSAGKDLAKRLPEIKKYFKEIAICFDDDEAGSLAVEEVSKMIPDVKVIRLPLKDANACLMEGKGKQAYLAAKWKAETQKNTRIVWLDDIWEDAKEPAQFGVSWPWEALTKITRGIRKGETIYFGAAQKMGKSEILNQIAAHLVAVHNWKVLLAKPEEANVKTAKLMAGKIAHARFHDPNVPFDIEKYEKAGAQLLGHKVCMLNLYQHLGWDSLKADIYAAAAAGVDAVFIDPITNLTNGMNSGDANTVLQEIAQELAAMSKDLNIVIFIFCHLRNPDGGLPHDRGGAVLTSQFAGSRAMGRSCNYMLGLEGDKSPELLKEERNIRTVVLLDDREYGEAGRFPLYWDDETTMFNQM
jgi:twinkle protein